MWRLLVRLVGLVAGLVMLGQALSGQSHCNAWLRVTIGGVVRKGVVVEEELQLRRQNGYGNRWMLDRPLLYSGRCWVHYEASAHLKLSVSPFAYFSHYAVIEGLGDVAGGPHGEVRFTVAGEVQGNLLEKVVGVGRAGLEYRLLAQQGEGVVRWRNRLGIGYDWGDRLRLGLYDELLVNVAGGSGRGFFDQHRTGLGLVYKLTPRFKVEIGYLWSFRGSQTGKGVTNTHHVVLNFSFRLGGYGSLRG